MCLFYAYDDTGFDINIEKNPQRCYQLTNNKNINSHLSLRVQYEQLTLLAIVVEVMKHQQKY